MIINYTATFRALDMEDAVRIATKRWRAILSKPDAELPWGAVITIDDVYDDDEEGKNVELRISQDYGTRTT